MSIPKIEPMQRPVLSFGPTGLSNKFDDASLMSSDSFDRRFFFSQGHRIRPFDDDSSPSLSIPDKTIHNNDADTAPAANDTRNGPVAASVVA